MIYSIAVFAHILDEKTCMELFNNIHSHLNENGVFALFEQTGLRYTGGDTWCRRTSSTYVEWALSCGFRIQKRLLISFPFHRFFEKRIAPYLRIFAAGDSPAEKCMNCNRSKIFNATSKLFLDLSGNGLYEDNGKREGNSLYIFSK